MILDVCAEKMPSRFSHDFGRVCQELAKNLPSHTTPVSIAALLRPRDVRPDLPVFFGKDREVGPAECAERLNNMICTAKLCNWYKIGTFE